MSPHASEPTPTRRIADVNNTAQLVALWLHGKTDQSQRVYESDARSFIAFLAGQDASQTQLNDASLLDVTINDVQAFADYLEKKGYSASTRNRRLAVVRSLLKYGLDCEYLHFNAAKNLKLPTPKNTLTQRILSELEAISLIALERHPRNKLILQFLYYTAARVGEVETLTWNDIRPGRDGVGQVTLFGKGNKTRVVVFPAELYRSLLQSREGNSPSEPVFKSRKGGKPVRARQIREIVAIAGERIGIKGVSPHWLRHSHATHSLERNAPIQLVQQTLGHQSLSATSRYLHARPNDSSGLYLPR